MTRALAAGRRAGFEHDPGAFRGALAWVDKMTDPATGRTGYQERGGPPARTNEMLTRFPPAKSEALTASALCIRLDAGQDVRGEASRASVALVASRPPVADDPGAVDLYAWFHATDALRRVGGAVWEDWRRALIATLLPRQQTAKAGCARGSFAPDDPWGDIGGRVYSTAMSVLCLELSGTSRQKPAQTAEVRAAVAALTDATASGDDAVKSAAEAALADIRAAYR